MQALSRAAGRSRPMRASFPKLRPPWSAATWAGCAARNCRNRWRPRHRRCSPASLVGPVEVPGGYSILLMVDRRQVLTADPRDATLSLKQSFPRTLRPVRTPAQTQASELAGQFCGAAPSRSPAAVQADAVANRAGGNSRSTRPDPDAVACLRQLAGDIGQRCKLDRRPSPLDRPPKASASSCLCGRDMPNVEIVTPNLAEIEERLLEEKINKRAQRYLRDLRRDAVIEYQLMSDDGSDSHHAGRSLPGSVQR